MSMLAEPRQRKTYNLVPRGKALYEDDCRFGTKMLKKMGWNKEKGLGANEDGTTEFVRVQYKNNVKGLGYEERDDQWTQHEQSFSGLLQNLNGATKEVHKEDSPSDADDDSPRIGFGFPTEQKQKAEKLSEKISGESLEEKSKRSKARVHYKKFTRGKDLTRYSEKDLANIFGKKAIEQSQENGIFGQLTAISVNPNDSENEDKEEKENFAGVQTINTGVSVGDYFKQKMEAMRNKMKKSGAEEPIEIEQEQSEIQSEVVEVSLKRKPSPDKENCIDDLQPKKKKKKKDKKEQFLENAEEQTIPAEDLLREPDNNNIKRKKEKKTARKSTEKEGLQDAQGQQIIMESKEDLSIESTSDIKNTKRKKEKKISRAATADEELQATECESSKKNKVKKSSKSTTEDTELNAVVDSTPEESSKSVGKKGKTKKSSKQTREKLLEDQDEVKIKAESNGIEQDAVIEDNKKSSAPLEIDEYDLNNGDETLEDIINSKNDQKQALDIATMTVDEMRDKVKAADVILISTFNAERFRNCQLDAFKCSNIANITGYSCTADLQLNIQNIKGDEKRIMELWTGKINKYADQMPKYTYQKYVKSVYNARKAKVKKLPKLHVKTFKRVKVFQSI